MRMPRTLSIGLLLVTLATCSHQPRYYKLPVKGAGADRGHRNLELVVTPVKLARYLNTPKIVMETTGGEIRYFHHHLWAENPGDQITHFLIDRLRSINTRIWATGKPDIPARTTPHLKVRLDSFNADNQGQALIKGEWQITKNARLLHSHTFQYLSPIRVKGVEGLLAALTSALDQLVQDLNNDITPYL